MTLEFYNIIVKIVNLYCVNQLINKFNYALFEVK